MGTILIEQAERFALIAHGRQLRKYTNELYINHPAAVAKIVASVGGTEEMVAAAWLHDVVEDTPVELQKIYDKFGRTVGDFVDWLTERPREGNRAARKAHYALILKNAPNEVKTIKLADLIDNSSSIIEHDPNFARVYLAEKRHLLDFALRGGDIALWVRANNQVVHGLQTILMGAIK